MHNFSEIDRIVIFAMASGALGGLIQGIIQDIINQIKNAHKTNLIQKIKLYVFSCFTGSILMGLFIFFGAMFDTSASIDNSGQFIIFVGIIGLPLITISTEILENFVFRSEDN